jgi:putative transposase
MKSVKQHIKISTQDEIKLETLSNEHRLVYNHVLAYIKDSGDITFQSLFNEARDFRNEMNLTISAKSTQNTVRDMVNNMLSYFALRKKDTNARFPKRFKSWKYFTSFTHDVNGGHFDKFIIKDAILTLKFPKKHKIDFKLNERTMNELASSDLRQIKFQKDGDVFALNFVLKNKVKDHKLDRTNFLSIDPGLLSIATAYSNATESFQIKNSRFKKLHKEITSCQSKKDGYKVGSRKHKKLSKKYRKLNAKASNKRTDYQHKVSKYIVQHCVKKNIGTLIVGDIKTKKLAQTKTANKGLNRSTQNEGTLGRFLDFVGYKAKNEGIHFIRQNEAYTSQTNCLTHERNLSSDLKHRRVKINDNIIIDRDLNSAINIAYKNSASWLSHFDEETLVKANDSFQEKFYDVRRDKMIISYSE